MKWDDEPKAELKRLWASGLSAAQVAARMGITRNAVLSKVAAMGLPHRLTVYTSPRSRKFATVQPQQLPLPLAPGGPKKQLRDLGERDCRWPHGDPRQPDFHFCGAKKVMGHSYCSTHMRVAYVPVPPRRFPSIIPVVAPARVVEEVA